jgi:hypothetical protein
MKEIPHKEFIVELSDILEIECLKFFAEKFKAPEESGLILNLVLSAHLSSLVNIMRAIANGNHGVKRATDEFIKELLDFVSSKHHMQFGRFYRDN